MAENISKQQLEIRVGTHGEDYGSWMSNPVFYVFGGLVLLAAVLAVLSFTTFHLTVLGVLLAVVTAALLIMLIWMAWIRRQYAFGKGGMMERVHQFILSNLDFDGHGEVLEVGCGSGALIVRTALTWPEAKITGLDYWGRDVQLLQIRVRAERRVRGRGRALHVRPRRRQQARLSG